MIEAAVRKIQILTDRSAGLPLFYCHSADVDHNPILLIEKLEDQVIIRARQILYKVKINPQGKNRVDIYMGIPEARHLGHGLVETATVQNAIQWRASNANPHAAARGNMQLPNIIWAKSNRYTRVAARTDSGVRMDARNGYINVDLEFPHQTHIKMKEHEVHVGIALSPPTGTHDVSRTYSVDVPEHELQRGRNERNPINKVRGDFYLELRADVAAGLGLLLRDFDEPEPVGINTAQSSSKIGEL